MSERRIPESGLAVYVAAPLACVADAAMLAVDLRNAGHSVVSRWHAATAASEDPPDEQDRRRILTASLVDLDACEVLVALTHRGTPRATFCEVAWALALGRPVVWVCGLNDEGRNIFDAHESVTSVRAARGADVAPMVLEALAQTAGRVFAWGAKRAELDRDLERMRRA